MGRDNETVDLVYNCDFNATLITNDSVICVWNLKSGKDDFNKTNWIIGSGDQANFLGGPKVDAMEDETGKMLRYQIAN